MSTFPTRAVALAALTVGLFSCKGNGEPVTSYCEAVCDYAVGCAATERSVDDGTLLADCLADTRAADPDCANAESGEINAVARETLGSCVSAIQASADAGECDAMSGRIDDLKTGTTWKECATTGTSAQAVYNAARDAVTETGDQLCQRFTDTFCGQLDTCLIADLGEIPKAVTDELGTPFDLCVAKLDFQTQTCVTQSLYGEEESLDDVNPTRQAARECLRDFASMSCDALLAGDMEDSPECAGSFASAEDTVAFGLALVEVVTDITEAMDGM